MNRKAFTLVEIMLVVIIVGIIAGFALPNYSRSLERGYARDAMIQLTTLYSANQIYKAHNGSFLAGTRTLAQVNTALNINIIQSSTAIIYSYSGTSATQFTATARYTKGSTDYTIRVTEANLSTASSGGNPCCSSGSCSILRGSVPTC